EPWAPVYAGAQAAAATPYGRPGSAAAAAAAAAALAAPAPQTFSADQRGGLQSPAPAAPPVEPVAPFTSAASNGALADPVSVLADPFAVPRAERAVVNGAAATPAPAPVRARISAPPSSTTDLEAVIRPRRGMHPMAYAFIAMAAVFGGV